MSLNVINVQEVGDGNIISDSFTNIKNLFDTAGLIAGTFYTINDYQTIHEIPTSSPSEVVTGVLEELTVYAIADDEVSLVATSNLHAQDIIEYDITDVLAEDGITPRPGFITYRKDTLRNLSCHYDHRSIKYRRYIVDGISHHPIDNPTSGTFVNNGDIPAYAEAVDPSALQYREYFLDFGTGITHDASPTLNLTKGANSVTLELVKSDGTSLGIDELNTVTSTGLARVYLSVAKNAYVLIDNADMNSKIAGQFLSHSSTNLVIGNRMQLDVGASFEDVYTFQNLTTGGTAKNVSIGINNTTRLNNIVLKGTTILDVEIGNDTINVTISGDTTDSFIGSRANNIITSGNFQWSFFGDEALNSLVLGNFLYLKAMSELLNSTFYSVGNTFYIDLGDRWHQNTFKAIADGTTASFFKAEGNNAENHIIQGTGNNNNVFGYGVQGKSIEESGGWDSVRYIKNGNTNAETFDVPISDETILNIKTIKQTVIFVDLEIFEFGFDQDSFKIDSNTEDVGTTTITLGGTATPYIFGDTVVAGDKLDIISDTAGAIVTINGTIL